MCDKTDEDEAFEKFHADFAEQHELVCDAATCFLAKVFESELGRKSFETWTDESVFFKTVIASDIMEAAATILATRNHGD